MLGANIPRERRLIHPNIKANRVTPAIPVRPLCRVEMEGSESLVRFWVSRTTNLSKASEYDSFSCYLTIYHTKETAIGPR